MQEVLNAFNSTKVQPQPLGNKFYNKHNIISTLGKN